MKDLLSKTSQPSSFELLFVDLFKVKIQVKKQPFKVYLKDLRSWKWLLLQ